MNYGYNHGSQGDLMGLSSAPRREVSRDDLKNAASQAPMGTGDKIRTAALEGNIDVLTELLNTWKGDSVVNEEDTIGTTALHSAASHGHVACVKALLAAGANRNAKNHYGQTPMTHAQGQEIKDLLTAGSATQADAGICAIM